MGIGVTKILTAHSMTQKRAVFKGDLQWEMIKSGAWQCCLNCSHFSDVRSVCTLNNINQTPPPHIISVGCKDYFDETGIPF